MGGYGWHGQLWGHGPRPVRERRGRLEAEDKVLLVGDVRQHQAVEAGSPFEQLQKHGMTTAELNEIVRQRDPELKQAVAKLSVRQIREAVTELESRGKVIEITDERERLKTIAHDYSKDLIFAG